MYRIVIADIVCCALQREHIENSHCVGQSFGKIENLVAPACRSRDWVSRLIAGELTRSCTARVFGKRMKSEKMIPLEPLKKSCRSQESNRLVMEFYISE